MIGPVIEFRSTFFIRSGNTVVIGTKRLHPFRRNAAGSCTDAFPDFNGDGQPETGLYANVQVPEACYTARIYSRHGTVTEVGSTGLEVSQVFLDATKLGTGALSEGFHGPSVECGGPQAQVDGELAIAEAILMAARLPVQ